MFQFISLLIAVICFAKAIMALLLPDQFYTWRQHQYASSTIPRVVLIVPTLIIVLAVLAWYATVFRYQSSGWIVTAFTTLIAFLATLNLSRWSTHRQRTGEAIATQAGTRITTDLVILALGIGFAYLALFVYGGF